jgi:cell wall assembly regulator SMI1
VSTPMTRVEGWLSVNLPELLADLAPGCSEAALAETEAHVGAVLPNDLKELYRRHDGQRTDYYPGIFYGMQFLSLERVRRRWSGWKDVIESGFDDIGDYVSARPGAVKEVYASLGWIPFGIDSGGNCLGIDLDPGPTGTRGQVINFGRDENEKFVLAPSVSQFLAWLAQQLEAGNFIIDRIPMSGEGGYTVRFQAGGPLEEAKEPAAVPLRPVLNTRDPPTRHFLDSVKTMFAAQREDGETA